MKIIKLSIFLAIFSLACGSTTEKKTYAECYLRYEQEGEILLCEAKFKEGDAEATAQPKLMPDIFFNSGAMEKRKSDIKGLFYKSEQNGAYQNNYLFRLKDNQDKAFTLSLAMQPILGFSTKTDLSKKTGFMLTWQGEKLDKTERLTIIITDANGEVATSIVTGATVASEKEIPGAMFSGLGVGKGTLKLVKQKVEEKTENGVSMKNTYEYYTKEQTINIIE